MKLALAAFVIAVTGCASQPPPPPAQPMRAVGTSTLAPKAAAACIALKWSANANSQPVWVQNVLANDTAYDVYAPTQQPPTGSAAVVRTGAGGVGSAVGFRGTDTSTIVPGIVGQCAS
jgi:hypothetical protein